MSGIGTDPGYVDTQCGDSPPFAIYLKGDPGDPGLNGQNGTNGEDGDSAYQVAVNNGYPGTETEWLESLKGEPGPQGAQGVQGVQGIQGPVGPKGDTGEKGDRGDPGPQGFPGIQGPPGERGPKGDTGPQGQQGLQGDTGATGPKGDKGDTGDTGPQGPSVQSDWDQADTGALDYIKNKPPIPDKFADLAEGLLENMDGAPFPITNGSATKLFIARNTEAGGYDAVDYYAVTSTNPLAYGGHRFYTYNPLHGASGGVQFNFGTFGSDNAFYTGGVIVPGVVTHATGIDSDIRIAMYSPFDGQLMYLTVGEIAALLSIGGVNRILSDADFADSSVFTGSGYYTYYGTGIHTYTEGGTTMFVLTIPAVAATGNMTLKIRNNGSGTIGINAYDGVTEFYTTEAVSSITLAPGESAELHNDTEYWNVN